jgi:hypothetical protein
MAKRAAAVVKRRPAAAKKPKAAADPGASDEAVRKATGKGWDQWCKVLDAAGAATSSHKDIAIKVHDLGAGDWWSQMVAVGYEKLRGVRVVGQDCDGNWRTSGSKTFEVPVATLFKAFADPRTRARWLGEKIVVRKMTAPKSLRITWSDGKTDLDVNLVAKGPGRSLAAVEHRKLSGAADVAAKKAYWAEKLGRLKALIEA